MNIPQHLTGTGNVTGTDNGGDLYSAVLTAAGAAATLTLRSNGASGDILLVLKAPIGTSQSHVFDPAVVFAGPLHATLAGAGAVATAEV